MDGVFGFGDSAGVAGASAFAEAEAGTGVEDATGVGNDEAGGATALTDCPLATVAWNALSVKKLSTLRIEETLFICNVTLIEIARDWLQSPTYSRARFGSTIPVDRSFHTAGGVSA